MTFVMADSSRPLLGGRAGEAHDGDMQPTHSPLRAGISLTGLEKSFGDVHAVRGIDLAIAIVADPGRPVLDEPTVALDVEGRHAFWSAMRNFAQDGKTVVFATHYLEEADAFADRVVLMAQGRIVADGSSTEIKARVGM